MTPSSTSLFTSSSIASPSGSSRSRSSFLQVQKREEEEEEEGEEEEWKTVLLDEDESTTIKWVPVLFHSIWMAVVKWQVPGDFQRYVSTSPRTFEVI
jgi:hypothetical protein